MNGKKNIFKLVLAFVVLVCTLFTLITVTASAETTYLEAPVEKLYSSSSPADAFSMLDEVTDATELKNYLRQELKNCPAKIDVSSFKIPGVQQYLDSINEMIWYDIVEMFHVNGVVGSVANGYIAQLSVSYNMSKESYTSMRKECLSQATNILDGIEGNPDLSDVQKALLIHDRLAVFCEYDYANYLRGTVPHDSYTMYGALAKGIAVCQGYSEAYLYLLSRVGIDSYICSSDALDHAWNIVTINGRNYHVDVTWDDPAWDKTGYVWHENFLVSNSGIYNTGHNATDYDTSATDTRYDNAFWKQSHTSFELIGNEIYYVNNKNKTLNKYSDHSVVVTIKDVWYASSHAYYEESYSCLSSNGNDLFYSTAKDIYKFDVNTGTSSKICAPEIPGTGYFYIYGFKYDRGYLVCDVFNSPTFDENTKKNYQQRYFYEEVNDDDAGSGDDVGSNDGISSIEIEQLPSKAVYYIGDELSLDGLTLKVNMNNGDSETVSEGFEVLGFDSLTAGKKTLTVSYEEYTASYEIDVKTPRIVLDKDEIKLEKFHSYEFEYYTEPEGLVPLWTSSDTHVVIVDSKGKVVSGYRTGTVTITATFVYNGMTYSDTCEVSVECAHFGKRETYDVVPSTCMTQGHGAYILCLVCNSVIEGSDEPLPLADHNYVKNTDDKYLTTAATCINPAVYAESCSVCGQACETFFSGDELDANNHVNTEIIHAVEPCVDKDGLTQGLHRVKNVLIAVLL